MKPFHSVNIHLTRLCSFSCRFCFHGSIPHEDNKPDLPGLTTVIKELAKAKCRKINYAGGEPSLFLPELLHMLRTSKESGIPVTSVITNGHYITREWLVRAKPYLDILGISFHSASRGTAEEMGFRPRARTHTHDVIQHALDLSRWCHELGIAFKVNTVVNACNVDEHLAPFIARLNPCRWKVFQVLPLGDEVDKSLLVSRHQFEGFVARQRISHPDLPMIPEPNEVMQNSYVLIDHRGRFLDCGQGSKRVAGPSIVEVGLQKAFETVTFDHRAFMERDGLYERGPSALRLVDIESAVDM
eukprot:gnl/Dysnectes_brevis/7317_a12156_262.p1 GENE.gnl/Dysnectes_brevis/7317_a12156_262~~gnl/Dysnectes_brevis/7317_a12156_262.p1  ORF type:complete len:300 (-),score=109.09 gnl/Dysnectes_brevis/7317_a12156_262:23-922(-)